MLAAAIGAASLSGCGNDPVASSNNVSSGTNTESSAAQTDEMYVHTYPIVSEPVTFTAACNMDGVEDHLWYQAYAEATNVNIEWTFWADWATQMGVALSANELPDIIFNLYASMDKPTIAKHGKAGAFADYSQYLEYMPYLTALMEEYPESRAAVQNDDGSIYNLPTFLETLTSQPGTIYYRTDMFGEAGISEPKTTDELLNAVSTLQNYFGKDNQDFVAMQIYNFGHIKTHLLPFLFPAFGDEVDMEFAAIDGKTVTYNYTSDQYRRTLEFVHEIYNSGGFDKNIYSEDGTNAKAVILNNNTAITTFGTMYSIDNFSSGNYDVDIMAPLTSEWSSEQKYRKQYATQRGMFQISAKCSDIETLVKWVDSLYAPEDQPVAEGLSSISQWLGIKGVDWDYDDDTKETYTINVPEDFDGAASNWLNVKGMENALNCVFPAINSSSPGMICKGIGTRDKLLPYSVKMFPVNYLTFTSDESLTIGEIYTDIKTFSEKWQAQFIMEGITDETWDAYVEQIKKIGIDEIVKIYQAAYDRYLEMLG